MDEQDQAIAEPIEDTEPVDGPLFEIPVADEIVPGPDPQHAPEEPPPGAESVTGLVDPPVPEEADKAPIQVVETECAFLVYLVNGHWLADGAMEKTIKAIRPASFDDFRHAATTITSDLQAHATAQAVIQGQMQQQVMQQQAANAAEIARRTGVGGGVDLSQLAKRR
jgi:hypothetical protein